MLLIIIMAFFHGALAQGASCFPAENIWYLTNDVCSKVDFSNSTIDASLGSIYDTLTDIDATLALITGSSIEVLVTSLENIIVDLVNAGSLSDKIMSDLDTFSTQLENLIDAVSVLDTLDESAIAGTCSCLDIAVQSSIDLLGSHIDTLTTDIDSCCSTLSMLDAIIKSDVDSVSTKVDSVSNQVSAVKSDLDSCCSVVNSLNTCLVGTAITQAMVPYTITTPGDYYLCENVTTSGFAAITIAANNVHLDLAGHTIINTNNTGIVCFGRNNIYIENGTIRPLLQVLNIQNSTNVHVYKIIGINAASAAVALVNNTNVRMEDCLMDGTNGTISGFFSCVWINGCNEVSVLNCGVLNHTITGGLAGGFWIVNSGGKYMEFDGCYVDGAERGFLIQGSNAVFRNCTVTNIRSFGFNPFGGSSIEYDNCVARDCGGRGFEMEGDDIVIKRCIADSCLYGFASRIANRHVYEDCIANNNVNYGFYMEGGINGVTNNNLTLINCISTNNVFGFVITSFNANTVLDRCIATGNSSAGIFNVPVSSFFVDCRTQNAVTTVNPAYNLNTSPDTLSGATKVIIS